MDQSRSDIRTGTVPLPGAAESSGHAEPFFVDALVDPVSVFGDPGEVVRHPWFTHEEKRTILLSWARDALALEQVASRSCPDFAPSARADAVIEALARFDPRAAAEYRSALMSVRGQDSESRDGAQA